MTRGGVVPLLAAGGDDRLLTDGVRECQAVEGARLVQSLVDQLHAHGIGPTDYVEFACEHDLPNALLWLALLDAGISAFINAVDARRLPADAPAFCRWRVHARWDDVLSLVVTERAGWNGARVMGRPRMVFRTSGTTGASKAVAHAAEHLRRNAMNCVERLRLRSTDRVVIPVPIYHMFGLGAAFLPGVLAGASMEFQGGSNLLRFMERERQFQPNVAFLTPAFMATLLKGRRGARQYDLTVVAGDILKPELARAYEARFGPVVSLYGSTELGAIAAASPADAADVRERTVGRPMPGVECRIEEQLWCRHPDGFQGYVDERGELIPREPDAWFPTRDRAEWHEGEWLRLLGRIDHCVKRDGVLVALGDVEDAMLGIAGLEAVVAVVAGDSPRGRGVVAFCTPSGAAVDAEVVRQACIARMPPSHVPDRIEIVAAFPALRSGKPDRVALARAAEDAAR